MIPEGARVLVEGHRLKRRRHFLLEEGGGVVRAHIDLAWPANAALAQWQLALISGEFLQLLRGVSA
jgi:hypothetical protein